jgi:CubicO group peptidase (beta-lactamase class C family)
VEVTDDEGPDRGRRLSLAALGLLGLGVMAGVTGEVLARVLHPAQVVGATTDDGPEATPTVQPPTLPPQPGRSYKLDVNGFTHALHTALTSKSAGYAMQLRQNGSAIATLTWGWAKEPQDGSEHWTPDVRMHIASISKLITAMALTKLFNDKGMRFDTPIVNYLPAYWAKGPNIDRITFAELLTHKSGLDFGSAGNQTTTGFFQMMKSQIAAGTTHIGHYNYQNGNFGLCRILMATVKGDIPVDAQFGDASWDSKTVSSYRTYVTDTVFSPAGVSGPTLTHEPADALAYNFPVSGHGWNSGDVSGMTGAAGWHVSVDELLTVMGAFRRTGKIMNPERAQTMLDNGFGVDRKVSTPMGPYYTKNGGWGNRKKTDPDVHTEHCEAFFLPQNIEFVILVNSPVGRETSLAKIVQPILTDNIVPA